MSEIKTSIILNMAGNLARQAAVYSQSLGKLSTNGRRHLSSLNRTVHSTGRALDRMGNRYVALATGAGATAQAHFLIGLERRFTRLGIQAGKTDEQIEQLQNKIYDTALAPDIRIDPGQITSAIEAIVEKTGDLDFAENNIRNIGLAIQATGAQGGAIGELLAEFQKMGITAPAEVLKGMDTLNLQGKSGAFTLQNLAALGPRVITAYTALGRTGTDALKEMGAALQLIRMGTGSSEQAATAFEATLATLGDPKKLEMLQQAGIQIFDPEEMDKGLKVLRPINEVMADIVKRADGDITKIGQVFDREAARSFNQAAAEYSRTGQLETLERLVNIQGNGETTLTDSARAANNAAGAMQILYTVWQRFADESLTGPIQSVADILNSISSETTGNIIKGLAVAGLGAVVAGKTYKAANWVTGKRKSSSMKAGNGLGGIMTPVPVFVVNQIPGLGNGIGRKGKGLPGKLPGKATTKAGKIAQFGARLGAKVAPVGRYASRALAPLAVVASGFQLASTWNNDEIGVQQKAVETGKVAGGMAGAYAMGSMGAAIGTAILPGVGTAIGGILGGGLGYFGGEKAAEIIGNKIADILNRQSDKDEKPATLQIELTGSQSSRAKVQELRGNRNLDLDVDSGVQIGGIQ